MLRSVVLRNQIAENIRDTLYMEFGECVVQWSGAMATVDYCQESTG